MANTMPIYREARMHFFFKGNMWEEEFKSYIPEMLFLNVSKKDVKMNDTEILLFIFLRRQQET